MVLHYGSMFSKLLLLFCLVLFSAFSKDSYQRGQKDGAQSVTECAVFEDSRRYLIMAVEPQSFTYKGTNLVKLLIETICECSSN